MQKLKYSGARQISEGKARSAGGNLFEALVDYLLPKISCDFIISAGKDDYITAKSGGNNEYKRENLHVDRHIFNGSKEENNRFGFIECKTYLDASYLTRAILNFIEIDRAIKRTSFFKQIKYTIFTGQICVAQDTYLYYEQLLKDVTGQGLKTFVINDVKTRNSSKPLCDSDYGIDILEIQKFINYYKK